MIRSTPVGFRLPDPLIARLDAFCASIEAQLPGATISRSNAIRSLLESALTAAGYPGAAPKAKPDKRPK